MTEKAITAGVITLLALVCFSIAAVAMAGQHLRPTLPLDDSATSWRDPSSDGVYGTIAPVWDSSWTRDAVQPFADKHKAACEAAGNWYFVGVAGETGTGLTLRATCQFQQRFNGMVTVLLVVLPTVFLGGLLAVVGTWLRQRRNPGARSANQIAG